MYGPLLAFLLGLVALYLAYLAGRIPYIYVHGLSELFGVVVAFSVFVVAWNFREQLRNNYLLVVGVAYLFVGALHLLHLLAYEGMHVFEGFGANLATQTWIAARYALALAFVIGPFLLGRRLRPGLVFGLGMAACVLVLLSIFQWDVFPTCYVEGGEPSPLTPFKKVSEVLIALMFLAAIPLLYWKREHFDPGMRRLITGALVASFAAEIPFILYRSVSDPFNLFGHLLLIVASFLIYKALVESSLREASERMEVSQEVTLAGRLRFDPWVLLTARTLARVCTVSVIAVGALVLAGWAFDVPRLKGVLTDGITMKANAAAGLVAAGLSLWLLQSGRCVLRNRTGQALAVLVAVIGGLTFLEHLSGWNLRIDELLFRDAPGSRGTMSPGRMGPPTSLCLLLLGAALLMMQARRRGLLIARQGLTLLGTAIAFLPLIGYIYDVPSLYAQASYAGIAVHAAVSLVVLGAAIMLARPDEGLMAVVTADRIGGMMARRLLLATILVPVVLGWLRIVGERRGLYGDDIGITTFVVLLVVMFTTLIWRNARLLNVLEEQREGETAERLLAERGLHAASQRLRSHVNSSPLAVVEYDADMRVTQWTGAAESMFGFFADDVIGRRIDEIHWIHEGDAEAVGRVVQDMLDGRRDHTFSLNRNYRKDGSVIYCEWHNSALTDRDGKLLSMLSLAMDVSERVRAEQALRQTNARLAILYEATSRLLGSEEPEDLIDALSRRVLEHLECEVFLGYLLDDGRLRLNSYAGIPEQEAKRVEHLDLGEGVAGCVARDGKRIVIEDVQRGRDPRADLIRSLGISAYVCHPLINDDRVIGTLSFGATMRDRFEADELALVQALAEQVAVAVGRMQSQEAETEVLERRVAERTIQLQEANRELESFSYSVSHDLRAPLRHIDGFAQLLARQMGQNLDAKAQRYLNVIVNTVKHAGNLVDDLLAFSRMGRAEMRRSRVDMARLVADVRQDLEPDMEGRAIEWCLQDLPVVQGDPAMLRIVLQNLLANAVKFTRERQPGRIEVGCRDGSGDSAGEYVFFVRDNGVGFDMKYADKLFGVFQRLHRPEQFEGTGIGLANVRRVVRRHGGRTWADAAVDAGATFYFSLPKQVDEVEE